MTADHKKIVVQFITRTGMFIGVVNEDTITSFIYGFEAGTNDSCDFTTLMRNYMEEVLAIPYRSDGWPGQIRKFAGKKYISWVSAFKQIGLEVLASDQNGGLNAEQQDILKSRIIGLLHRINPDGDPWLGRQWMEEWNAICPTKSEWFKQMWEEHEFNALKSITREINKSGAFDDWKPVKPTEKLLSLKDKFENGIAKQNLPRTTRN